MKQATLVASVVVATATVAVWLAWPSLSEQDSDKLAVAIERDLVSLSRRGQEVIQVESLAMGNDLQVPVPVQSTQNDQKADADAALLLESERAAAVFNAPTQSQLEDAGYTEIIAGERSSYAGYTTDTLVALAEAGDRQALLHASLRVSSLAIDKRTQYAVEAAKRGYTSALVGLGAQLLMPTRELSETQEPNPVLGFALMMAAHEAGDATLHAGDTWADVKSHVSVRQQEEAGIVARRLIEAMGTRL